MNKNNRKKISRLFDSKIIVGGVKLVLTTAIVVFGWPIAMAAITCVSHSNVHTIGGPGLDQPSIAPLALTDGQWEFDGCDWANSYKIMTRSQLNELLKQPSSQDVAGSNQSVVAEMQKLADNLNAQLPQCLPSDSDSETVNILRPQIVTRNVYDHQQESIVIANRAYEDKFGVWQWTGLEDRHATAHGPGLQTHLLPMKGDFRRFCSRKTPDNRLLLEIISVQTDRGKLLEFWRENGWHIRHSPHHPVDRFAYFCSRDQDFVYAWSASRGSQINSLMLVNCPSDSPSIIQLRGERNDE